MKKYASIYGSEKPITSQQYIAELAIDKCTKAKNIKLPYLFWNVKIHGAKYLSWTKQLQNQSRRAAALIKLGYSPQAIINVLKNNDSIYSLFHPLVQGKLEEEQQKIEAIESVGQTKAPETTGTQVTPVKRLGKQTKLNKLRD